MSHWNSWPLECHPQTLPELSEEGLLAKQSQSHQAGTMMVRCPPSCTVSRLALLGLPSALGDDMLRLGTHVPLYPGAIIDRHIGFATEEGPQDHVAGCDTGATCSYQGLGQVHILLLEQASDLLWALL